MCIHIICLCWASNLRLHTYTSHEHVSYTKTLSRHRRVSSQHAVQQSLNVGFTQIILWEHMDWNLPGLFQHHPWPSDQNQEPKEHVYSHLWMLETLSPYLGQLRVLVLGQIDICIHWVTHGKKLCKPYLVWEGFIQNMPAVTLGEELCRTCFA